MSKISKAVALAAFGTAAMAVSGAGMAAGLVALPGVFSIDTGVSNVGGVVSAACPVSSTCQNLEGTGDGMLLRSIQSAGGQVYIQTLIAENLGGGGLFANEQIVQQGQQGANSGGGPGANNIAQKMVIDDVAQGFTADHVLLGQVYQPTPAGNDVLFVLNQTIDLGNGAFQKVRLKGEIAHAGGDVADAPSGRRALSIDQSGGALEPEFGEFVYRWANTPAAFANLTLDNGLGGVTAGATNTNVAALYIKQSVTGMDNDFGLLKYGTGVGNNNCGDNAAVPATGTGPTACSGSLPPVVGPPAVAGFPGTWTPNLVSIDVLAGNPYSNVVSADPTNGYGTWGTGSVAEGVFGALSNTSDFLP